MPARGFNVFISTTAATGRRGRTHPRGAQIDIDAAMQALLARNDIDKDRIVMYGQSLGERSPHTTSRIRRVATSFAPWSSRARSPGTSTSFARKWPTLVHLAVQWLPQFTVDDRFSPLRHGEDQPAALLVLHGDQDGRAVQTGGGCTSRARAKAAVDRSRRDTSRRCGIGRARPLVAYLVEVLDRARSKSPVDTPSTRSASESREHCTHLFRRRCSPP